MGSSHAGAWGDEAIRTRTRGESDLCACVSACLCMWSRGGGEVCGAEGIGRGDDDARMALALLTHFLSDLPLGRGAYDPRCRPRRPAALSSG